MTFQIGKNPNAAKEAALRAAREAAAATKPRSEAPIIKYIAPEDCPEKIRLLADDSGSMCGQFENAKKGIVEFCRNCIPNQTAVAVHFLNGVDGEKFTNLSKLQSNLLLLSVAVEAAPFVSGGTPLFKRAVEMLQLEPSGTRFVMFTDGSPTDSLDKREPVDYMSPEWEERNSQRKEFPFDKYSADILVAESKKRNAPFDTVYFGGTYGVSEIALLKYISEQTGGFFLHFDPSKVNFAKAFKYLAPVNRLMLADASVRAEIEAGTRS